MSNALRDENKSPVHDRQNLTLQMVRASEAAAIAAAHWRGKGEERAADEAAAETMQDALNSMQIDGRIIIGEGTHGEAPMLYADQQVGTGDGPKVDIAVDPLEGTTLCAKAQNDAIVAIAASGRDDLMRVPQLYMHKVAIGPGYPEGTVELDASATDNVTALARAKDVPVSEITVCVLDRPRHGELIAELREIGAGVRLIRDGDIAAVIHAANAAESGIDIYLGSGGAPEGVLAAAAVKCLGGFMQARFIADRPDLAEKARAEGITDLKKIYSADDLAGGNVLFAATGVTNGTLVQGVKFAASTVTTSTIVMESWSGAVRWISARHAR